MHNKPYVNSFPSPQSWSQVRLELWSLACIAPKGERRGERWEESFCCYVLWESPVWRIYGLADSESWHGNVVCRSARVKQLRQPLKHTGRKALSCNAYCTSFHITILQKKNCCASVSLSGGACIKPDIFLCPFFILWLCCCSTSSTVEVFTVADAHFHMTKR